MKETPEEFLNRITDLLDEDSYKRELYGEKMYEDPESGFPSILTEEDEVFDLPVPEDSPFITWRDDCPRFPVDPPCDSCIYYHFNSNNYFIGGRAHGKQVPSDLVQHRTIQVPSFRLTEGAFLSSNMCVEEEVIRNTEMYIKRLIHVQIENGRGLIAIWVIESLADPQEAFQTFLRFAQRGE